MAGTVVLMNEERISQAGPPITLYDRPAITFAAGFIGSPAMNLIDGVFDKAPGSFRAAWGDSIQVAQPGAKPRSGPSAILGIRPEHAGIDVAGNGQTGKVAMVEPTGSGVHITLVAKDAPLQVVMSERLDLADGTDVSLTVAPQLAHDFGPATGSRLIN